MNWISVKEALPNEHELVIVWEGSDSWYGYYDYDKQKWSDDNFSGDMKVTHWMMFPEGPKE